MLKACFHKQFKKDLKHCKKIGHNIELIKEVIELLISEKHLDKKLKAGLNVIVNPDVVGAKYYKKKYNATAIFLMPVCLTKAFPIAKATSSLNSEG